MVTYVVRTHSLRYWIRLCRLVIQIYCLLCIVKVSAQSYMKT